MNIELIIIMYFVEQAALQSGDLFFLTSFRLIRRD